MSTAAIVGGTAAAGIASSAIGAHAASSAADAQVAAANKAADLQKQAADEALNFNKLQYGNSLNLLSPFYNTGTAANSRLAYLMGLSPNKGLPPGVVNPNAPAPAQQPQTQIGWGGGGSAAELIPRGNDAGSGGFLRASAFNAPVSASGGGQVPFQDVNGASLNPQNMPAGFTPNGVQPGSIQPGGQVPTTDNPLTGPNAGLGPAQFAGEPNDPTNPTGSPFQNTINGISPIVGGTPMNGSPGMVPRIDGGGDPNNPTAPTPGGGFGSLAQGWDKTFQSPTNLTDDPGYQFRLEQGQKALQNSAAARGGLLSGGTAKSLNDYAQGSASQEYQNTYNRSLQNYDTNYNTFTNDQTNTFNRLMALFNGGQVSANNLSASGITSAGNAANIGLTSAGQIGNQLNNAGAATASGYVGGANAITGGINSAANSLSTLAMLKQLQGGGTGSTGGSTPYWV